MSRFRQKTVTLSCFVFLFLMVVLTSKVVDATPLNLSAAEGRAPLSGHLEMLRDDTGTLTIQDIISPAHAARFKSVSGKFHAGFVKQGAIWLRFTVQRSANAPQDWILEVDPAVNEQLQLSLPSANGAFETRLGGSLLPFSQKEIPYRNDLFRLSLPPDQPQVAYLKIASQRAINANLVFWQPATLESAMIREALVHGAYLGIILLTLCITLLYFIRFKLALYSYYFFYVLSFFYIFLDNYGYAHQFICPDHSWLLARAMRLVMLLLLAMNAGLLSKILNLPVYLPRFDRYFRSICNGIAGVGTLLVCAGFHNQIIVPLQVIILVSILTSMGICIRLLQTAPGARWYLAAFGVLLLTALTSMLTQLGLLPANELFRQTLILSSILHIVVLTIATIDTMARIKLDIQTIESTLASETQTVENQREFLRLISHELRTQLTVIDSAAQIMPIICSDQSKVKIKSESIRAATRRLSGFLEKFLTNERLSSCGGMPDFHPESLRDLIEKTVDLIQSTTQFHQIQCNLGHAPEIISCDPLLIETLLGNLLENAIKFSPDGGEILLRAYSKEQNKLVIEITDYGVGMTKEQSEQAFNLFYRSGTVKGMPGTGLGLSLVQRIAKLHGGSVSCTSQPGHGTVFAVTLANISADLFPDSPSRQNCKEM